MIHLTSDVQTTKIGEDTDIWQNCVILPNAIIGKNCNINCNVFIENDVVIGNNVTVKSGVQLWDGIILEDNVFVGPNATFTNDLFPRSKQNHLPFLKTVIKKGASIGANATILSGITIGQYALVGAGSVVTKSIPAFELWVGNPARHVGHITELDDVLDLNLKSKRTGKQYEWKNKELKERLNQIIEADGISMRLIEKSDAEFIIKLRTNEKIGKFLSWTSTSIDDQINWIIEYKKKEANQKEFYFIFEDSNRKSWGAIRLYSFTNDSFTMGSWICLPGNKEHIAIKAWFLAIRFGFEKLKYKSCMFDIRKNNKAVLYFSYLLKPTLIKEDELVYFFQLDRNVFYKNHEKVRTLLNFKFER